jgi:hypothetical protein
MKRAIAIFFGFLSFGLVGYVGGPVLNQPSDQSEAIRQLELRIERLERHQASRSDCACIRVPEGSHEIEIGGVHFYLVPVNGEGTKGERK